MATISPMILVDLHERSSGVPERLLALGIAVETVSLPVGDYIVARGVAIERKAVLDLHDSVLKGRFWNQIGDLRRRFPRPYLLVEGTDLDRGPLHPNGVRGVCLAVLEQGVPIIRSQSPADSALWIARLQARARLVRPGPDRPPYDQKPSPPSARISEVVLAAVPGISVALARRLLERFGSVAGVVEAGPTEWQSVAGIGDSRAARLSRALGHPDRASRPKVEKLPVARAHRRDVPPGGTCVAGSGQAAPRHLRGDP